MKATLGLDMAGIPAETTRLLMASNQHPGVMRPFLDDRGQGWIQAPVMNAHGQRQVQSFPTNNALLRYDEYKIFDNVITATTRTRTGVFTKLSQIVQPLVLPTAMAHSMVQYQMTDTYGQATLSMDPARRTVTERGNYDTGLTPLPIVHVDFSINIRELMQSRANGVGLDTVHAENGAAAIAEKIERLTVGTDDEFYYGGGYIYGLTNHPDRLTGTITSPEADGWEPETLCDELAAEMATMYNAKNYGPYHILYGADWLTYMQKRYNQYDSTPLAAAVRRLDNVASFEIANFLTGYQMVMIDPQAKYVRTIIGMAPTPVQWSNSPMDLQMKIMGILIPQIRSDYDGNSGVNHLDVA